MRESGLRDPLFDLEVGCSRGFFFFLRSAVCQRYIKSSIAIVMSVSHGWGISWQRGAWIQRPFNQRKQFLQPVSFVWSQGKDKGSYLGQSISQSKLKKIYVKPLIKSDQNDTKRWKGVNKKKHQI